MITVSNCLLRRFDFSRKQASSKQEKLGASMKRKGPWERERRETKRLCLFPFPLPFFPCAPSTFGARERSGNEAVYLIFVFALNAIFKTRFTFLRYSFNELREKLTGLLTLKLFDSFSMIALPFPFEENKSVIDSLFHTLAYC